MAAIIAQGAPRSGSRIQAMPPRCGPIGRIQLRCRRAALVDPGGRWTTAELMRWVYPRLVEFDRWHWNSVRRGARRRGKQLLWAPKAME